MTLTRSSRLLAAGFVLIGGLIHYSLWSGGYRFIPSIGPLFLANLVVSVLVAVALLASGRRAVVAAGAALTLGSLGALVASRTVGLLGFTESWTEQSFQVLAAEAAAVVALAMVAAVGSRDRRVPAFATSPAAPRRRG
ncbi:MAG TPA: hypothetical protein VM942_08390 [Acidimicrobiales bacterium]|nr:hypothetical protein [Acidimicrobiales bacterium]